MLWIHHSFKIHTFEASLCLGDLTETYIMSIHNANRDYHLEPTAILSYAQIIYAGKQPIACFSVILVSTCTLIRQKYFLIVVSCHISLETGISSYTTKNVTSRVIDNAMCTHV